MVIQEDVKNYVENHIKFMIKQTESYLPFIKTAFPYSTNLSDACFSLIAGNALSVFINQYAMRLAFPSIEDFEEFGKITGKYRDQVEKFFK